MELKKKLLRKIQLIGLLFLIIIGIVTLFFYNLNTSMNHLITESQPALETIDHMENDLLLDSTLMYQFLSSDNYSQLIEYEETNQNRNTVCSRVYTSIEQLINLGKITDVNLISTYEEAKIAHGEVEFLKEQLIDLHKREVLLDEDLGEKKSLTLDKYSESFISAQDKIDDVRNRIENRNNNLRNQLALQIKIYFATVIVLFLIFIVIISYSLLKVWKNIVTPLDEISSKTRSFVDGSYSESLEKRSDIKEMNDLQENINSIFSTVENISQKPSERKAIKKNLLKHEYKMILDYLAEREKNNTSTTIKDLKKYLNVTHPTISQKLRYLEERDFVTIEKSGRDKNILLK